MLKPVFPPLTSSGFMTGNTKTSTVIIGPLKLLLRLMNWMLWEWVSIL